MTSEHFPRPEYSPDACSCIDQMEELMHQSPAHNNMIVPCQFALKLMELGMVRSLGDFEGLMRTAESHVRFIAAPLDFFGTEHDVKYPPDMHREDDPQYVLFVSVLGQEEADALLENFGMTAAENRLRLEYTGIMVMRKARPE